MLDNILSVKILDFDYVINKPVNILINNFQEKAIVLSMNNKYLIVSLGYKDIFKKNKDVTVSISYKECTIELLCKIKDFDDGILTLILPRQAQKIQQREHFRVQCNIKCEIERLSTATIKNISVGGVFIELDKSFESNKTLDYFRLSFSLNGKALMLKCEAIEHYKHYLRAKFVDIPKDSFNFIESYCTMQDISKYRGRIFNER